MHTLALSMPDFVNLLYLVAAVLFIFGLKQLSSVPTAKRGNLISAVGMLLATVVTFFYIAGFTWYGLIGCFVALLIGAFIGARLATKVEMTGMPEMVALFNGFGGIASLLVAGGDYFIRWQERRILWQTAGDSADYAAQVADLMSWNALLTTGLAVLVGGVTFTGSIVAYAKLSGAWPKLVPDQPVQFHGQKVLVVLLLLASLALSVLMAIAPESALIPVLLIAVMALTLGILLVIGIGGADMPVVISLLNSYSGIAAAFAGFVLNNTALIVTGSLVGASGLILTNIMCKAMNRSLLNVLFGGMGATSGSSGGSSSGAATQGEAQSASAEDAAIVLDAAQSLVIVPGYGMAVAQAQHAVKDLAALLEERGVRVTYAIHPVAGRMPGHMNVLLAEAGVPYEQLLDLDDSNQELENADVALVIGANDVTNPAARHDEGSPIYGMPILNVDSARTVFVIKRSLNPGFAGIQNELYFQDNTRMLFGDAKKMATDLADELSEI